MNHLKLHTPDLTAQNIAELFPDCLVETRSPSGTRKIEY